MLKVLLFLVSLSCLSYGAARRQDQVMEYVYDFSTSGGSSATIDITNEFGRQRMPANALVYQMGAKVVTAFTGSAGISMSIGNTGDPDGYMQNVLVSSLTDNVTLFGDGAKIWDDSNDHPLFFLTDDATDRDLIIDFNGTVTAGKMIVWLKYYVGSVD